MIKLFQLEKQQKIIKKAINDEKKLLNKQFIKEHKTIIRVLDIAMILVLLFNFGAVAITNAMVMKKEPDYQPREVNLLQAKIRGYEEHPQAKIKAKQLLITLGCWSLLIAAYAYLRMTARTSEQLMYLIVTVITWVLVLGHDFFNDFGFWIGKIIWGG